MQRILMIIPGFGGWDQEMMMKKLRILHHNVKWCHIQNQPMIWIIRLYSLQFECLFRDSVEWLNRNYSSTQSICWFAQPGQMGSFLRDSCPRLISSTSSDDHVCIMLDDIELCPSIDFTTMRNVMQKFNLDLLSPSLHAKSVSCHHFMRSTSFSNQKILRITNFAELFLYMMTLSKNNPLSHPVHVGDRYVAVPLYPDADRYSHQHVDHPSYLIKNRK